MHIHLNIAHCTLRLTAEIHHPQPTRIPEAGPVKRSLGQDSNLRIRRYPTCDAPLHYQGYGECAHSSHIPSWQATSKHQCHISFPLLLVLRHRGLDQETLFGLLWRNARRPKSSSFVSISCYNYSSAPSPPPSGPPTLHNRPWFSCIFGGPPSSGCGPSCVPNRAHSGQNASKMQCTTDEQRRRSGTPRPCVMHPWPYATRPPPNDTPWCLQIRHF